ncbi:MAG: quinolinate synthase NadA [Alphaproteobacteria bacterium]|jgi:quinolinate synthase|uniref:Quinolinate synthase n=1 Tax=PS1 clade bacterium TaxID=2175152 RepID=A0A368DS96_9PROT|nr:quinolinate synthase [Rhodobiaceae bacterium]OUT73541.1 MAG: quinolinate synthase [Rhizobiales bacterium TMED25]RCL74153.1 MAG: quinolinate synthase NadA [PS1 clade bacterium]|tara:strand:+ start:3018 stop:4055 length:1038 start_codon:yes stop_codon:yes gene_type:complete
MKISDYRVITELPNLDYTPQIAKEMEPYYEKVKTVIPKIEWPYHAPYVKAINKLKKERNAVCLVHNYMTPEIYHCVADFVGDSLALSKEAARTDADIIIQCGVHFMAETSKILNPDKIVLTPDMEAGCSLAESITGQDVRNLKKKYPGVPVVTYVNTSADVKAESDICCTSGNAKRIVESLGVGKVIFIPDKYLAQNIAKETDVEIIWWDNGCCEVHELFTPEDLIEARESEENLKIIAHPECPPNVVAEADFSGSTARMIEWVTEKKPEKVMMVTECSMSDNIAAENPETKFIRPCNMCPHMKKITLSKILNNLLYLNNEVIIDAEISKRAYSAVDRMIKLDIS